MKKKILYICICICLMTLCLIKYCKKVGNKQKNEQEDENNNFGEEIPSKLNYEDIFLYYYDFDTCTYLIKGIKSQYESLSSYEVPTSYDGVPIEFKYNYEYYTKAKGYFITEYNDGKYLGNEENPYLVLMETIRANVETFTIHPSTKIIGSEAFVDCYKLNSIVFSNNVEYIDGYELCSSLTNITIPNEWIELWDRGYTEKGNQILSNFIGSLTDLYLNNGIQIEGVKFTKEDGLLYFGTNNNPYYCLVDTLDEKITQLNINEETVIIFNISLPDENKIKTLTIPSKVEYIYSLNTKNVETIYFPASLKKISSKAFRSLNCDIVIDEENEYYKSINGAVYSKDGKKLLHYLVNTENETLQLEETIEEIYPYCFKVKDVTESNVKKIIIPNNVKHIGECAFSKFELLESINIPDCVKIVDQPFDYNVNIKNLELGKGIIQWYNVGFFAPNAKIYYNGSLEEFLHIYFESSIFPYESEFEFYYKKDNSKYKLAESIDLELPKDITYIYYGQFANWKFLKSIKLHSNVTNVEEAAFLGCSNLTYNVYNNANYLGIGTNKYAILINVIDKEVYNVEIHPDTQIIQDGAFFACDYIESIKIPSNVTQINYAAFSACSNLKEIIFEENNNVVTIDPFSIVLIQRLEKLILPKQCIIYSNNIDYKIVKNVYYPGTISEWLELSNCFSYSYSSSSLDINFYCLNEKGEYSLVDEITLTDNIEKIDYYFDILYPQVTDLEITPNVKYIHYVPTKSLYIPSTVLEVSRYDNAILYFESTNPQFSYPNQIEQDEWVTTYYTGVDKCDIVNIEGMEFLLKDSFAILTCYKGLGGVVNIPDSIQVEGKTYIVNKIGTYAFTDCDNIQYIIIPTSIEMIQNFAFYGYKGLIYCEKTDEYSNEHKWYLYENSFIVYHSKIDELNNVVDNIQYNILSDSTVETVNYIGTESIVEVPSLVNLNGQIYQVTKIGNSTFKNNHDIETITLGEYVTEIGEYAFYNCTNLLNINVENIEKFEPFALYNCCNAQIFELKSNVNFVGAYAFYNNFHIKNINVNQIRNNSFENCTSLETVVINGKLRQYQEAFKNCINLKNITFGSEITFISDSAFENCISLESIKIPETIVNISASAFFKCTKLTIYVTTNEMLIKYTNSLTKEFSSRDIKDKYNPEWISVIMQSSQPIYHTIYLVD